MAHTFEFSTNVDCYNTNNSMTEHQAFACHRLWTTVRSLHPLLSYNRLLEAVFSIHPFIHQFLLISNLDHGGRNISNNASGLPGRCNSSSRECRGIGWGASLANAWTTTAGSFKHGGAVTLLPVFPRWRKVSPYFWGRLQPPCSERLLQLLVCVILFF